MAKHRLPLKTNIAITEPVSEDFFIPFLGSMKPIELLFINTIAKTSSITSSSEARGSQIISLNQISKGDSVTAKWLTYGQCRLT